MHKLPKAGAAGCSRLPHHISLVGNGRRRSVNLGQIDGELLSIGRRSSCNMLIVTASPS